MTSFTATGDALILEHFPRHDTGYETIKAHINRADVRVTNLETVIADEPHFANTFSGGGWITAPSAMLDDLQDLNFNFYACANNHAMDYAHEGLLSTIHHLKARNLLYAGIGENLSLASQPAFVQTPEGRVAAFSVGCLYEHQYGARAGDSHDGLPGRPGLNLLRRNCFIRVTDEQFRIYSEIAEMAGAYKTADGGYCIDNRHVILPAKEGEKTGRYTTPNAFDIQRITNQIRASRKVAGRAIVTMHAHANKLIESYIEETDPDYYLEQFAHTCIDAGADAVIGTGCHQLRGIEIYKGKPIFYSLGNFVFTVGNMYFRMPSEYMETCDVPYLTPGALAAASKISYDATLGVDPVYYRSVIPYWEMEGDKLTHLELLPIELDMDGVPGIKGFPHPCDPSVILPGLQKACNQFGTKLEVSGNKIVVNL